MKYLLFFMLFLYNIVNSQNIKVVYEAFPNLEDQLKKIPDKTLREQVRKQYSMPIYFRLTLQDNISLYKVMSEKELNSDSNNLDLEEEKVSENIKVIKAENIRNGLYQNYKTNEYLESQRLFGRDFFIKDNLAKFNWKLVNEEKKIGKFICKKATTTYNDEEITAWYTDEIPISVGPEFYNGLPGLIIKLNDDNQIYKAISVEYTTEKSIIKKPQPIGKEMSRDNFFQLRKEKIQAMSNP